jgi:hypothetical protein
LKAEMGERTWCQTPKGKMETPLVSHREEYQLDVPVVTVPWFEQERPNNQEGTPLEGIEAKCNATRKAALSSQVACKPDDSPMTYQLSRRFQGSKHREEVVRYQLLMVNSF